MCLASCTTNQKTLPGLQLSESSCSVLQKSGSKAQLRQESSCLMCFGSNPKPLCHLERERVSERSKRKGTVSSQGHPKKHSVSVSTQPLSIPTLPLPLQVVNLGMGSHSCLLAADHVKSWAARVFNQRSTVLC